MNAKGCQAEQIRLQIAFHIYKRLNADEQDKQQRDKPYFLATKRPDRTVFPSASAYLQLRLTLPVACV